MTPRRDYCYTDATNMSHTTKANSNGKSARIAAHAARVRREEPRDRVRDDTTRRRPGRPNKRGATTGGVVVRLSKSTTARLSRHETSPREPGNDIVARLLDRFEGKAAASS